MAMSMVTAVAVAMVAAGFIPGEEAMAIEEPAFETLETIGDIQIRQYPPVIVAETFVDGDLGAASSSGFRLIADYIFGNNLSVGGAASPPSAKIAMTAPVTVEPAARSEKIAMTAPVNIEPQGNTASGLMQGRRWRVQFTMPGAYTMATLPKPLNAAVTVRQVPGARTAALVFSGFAGEEKAQQKTDELLAWLKKHNRQAIATPQLARYNPPWTLPFLRRNEILVEIAVP